jgi:hypothetical protein
LAAKFIPLHREVSQIREEPSFRLHPPGILSVQTVMQAHIEQAEQ